MIDMQQYRRGKARKIPNLEYARRQPSGWVTLIAERMSAIISAPTAPVTKSC
jgi:hypothetical protein